MLFYENKIDYIYGYKSYVNEISFHVIIYLDTLRTYGLPMGYRKTKAERPLGYSGCHRNLRHLSNGASRAQVGDHACSS